jgi:hypothetical protein
MYTLEGLIKSAPEYRVEINGKWVPARPEPLFYADGFFSRLKDAWKVLKGDADAFTWPEGQ